MSAGWWSDEYVIKIEVWTGDLAKPRIGLSQDQWNRLSGNVPRPQRVDAIIHNGATVHWNTDFSSLRAANVESTFELLKVLDEAPSILKFVYVSGGYHATLEKQRNMQDIILSTAYAQTKFLSQMLVQEYSQQNLYSKSRVSIVKPSYIIGTAQEGIANTDDFIWRLVASCIQIGSYNEADADGWLFVSDVGHVASRIVNCCDTNDSSTSFLDIMDGLLVRDFWSILREFGYKLVPKKPSAWSSDLQVDIDARQEAHPLWPLLPTLEKGGSMIGVEIPPGALLPADSNSVKVAIRRNVEYLHEIGFLLKPEEPRKIRKEKAAGFTRSRRIDVFV
jgi:thioester reductase-like protein